jgi:hypothetical protein
MAFPVDFLRATFRANPAYELVLFDRLTAEERQALANLKQDPNFYGILRPRSPGLSLKSLNRDTALLLFTLQTPGPLPEYMTQAPGADREEVVAKLVLDRILEIEAGGLFLSGADAHGLLQARQPDLAAAGYLGRLSLEAIQYAEALDVSDSVKLSVRMYLYNRVPASPAWKRRFPSPEAVAGYLEVHRSGKNRQFLDEHWVRTKPPPDNPGWLGWSAPRRDRPDAEAREYKLYVSPRAEQIREALTAALEAGARTRARHLKIGHDIYGLLRPDKLVLYFERFEDVQEAAGRLRQQLKGMQAHGVPFTAALDEEGLLSWGMDPPRGTPLLPWQGPSWRRWTTDRLAVALLSAKSASPAPVEPWQFALDRLRLEGIDPSTWVPAQALWEN